MCLHLIAVVMSSVFLGFKLVELVCFVVLVLLYLGALLFSMLRKFVYANFPFLEIGYIPTVVLIWS